MLVILKTFWISILRNTKYGANENLSIVYSTCMYVVHELFFIILKFTTGLAKIRHIFNIPYIPGDEFFRPSISPHHSCLYFYVLDFNRTATAM